MLVICCGMPRSGSTLQFNVAWKIAEAARLGNRVTWRSSDDWAKADTELRQLELAPEMNVIKMHFVPENVKKMAESDGQVRFIYVRRDIRDVVYSMMTKFNFSLSHSIGRVRQALEVEDWLLRRPEGAVLVQDYSLLLENLQTAIRQVASFEGAHLTQELVASIENELSIKAAYEKSRQKSVPLEHLRRKLNRLLGRKVNFADDELMLHPNHVSEHRGQLGIGQEMLSERELDAIRAAFGDRVSGLPDAQ